MHSAARRLRLGLGMRWRRGIAGTLAAVMEGIALGQVLLLVLGGVRLAGASKSGARTALIPHVHDTDEVDVYVVESEFPFNAPATLTSGAETGQVWADFALTHAGLAFDNDDEHNEKWTVELLSTDYVGALLPNGALDSAPLQSLNWSNAAEIWIETEVNKSYWISSTYVARISGALVNDMRDMYDRYLEKHPAYQPVTVYAQSAHGNQALKARDSYRFVHQSLQFLARHGVDLKAIVHTRQTSLSYFATEAAVDDTDDGTGAQLPLVVAEGQALDDILDFYSAYGTCLNDLWQGTQGDTASFVVDWGPACLNVSGGVYVYENDTAYYYLASTDAPYAGVLRQQASLPDRSSTTKSDKNWENFTVLASLIAVLLVGLSVAGREWEKHQYAHQHAALMRKGDAVCKTVMEAEELRQLQQQQQQEQTQPMTPTALSDHASTESGSLKSQLMPRRPRAQSAGVGEPSRPARGHSFTSELRLGFEVKETHWDF